MNELMIMFAGQNWIYFATDKTNCADAFVDFEKKCATVGINIDNMEVVSTVLRNAEGKETEWVVM